MKFRNRHSESREDGFYSDYTDYADDDSDSYYHSSDDYSNDYSNDYSYSSDCSPFGSISDSSGSSFGSDDAEESGSGFYDDEDEPGFYNEKPVRPRRRRRGRKSWLLSALFVLVLSAVINLFHMGKTESAEGRASDGAQGRTPPTAASVPEDTFSPTTPPQGSADADPDIFGFYGNRLTRAEQAVYSSVYTGVSARDDTVTVTCSFDPDKTMEIYYCVINDHPEFFWACREIHISWIDYGGSYEVTLTPGYCFSKKQLPGIIREVESLTADLLSSLQYAGEYEKALGAYEFVINNTVYDTSYKGRSMYYLFTKGRGVCQSYAQAMSYLLGKLDMECIFITGVSNDERGSDGHAWNIVRIDGKYYNLDATWGDPTMSDGTQVLSHAYFCLTDEQIGKTHTRDEAYLPKCTATAANYYIHENKYLNYFDNDLVSRWISEAASCGTELEFQCADYGVYRKVFEALFDSGGIFDMMPDRGYSKKGYSYLNDDNICTLCISVYYGG